MFLRIDVGAKNCIHVGQVAFPARFEPLDDVAVEAQVDRGLSRRQDDARGFPEIRAERFGVGGVGAGLIETARAPGADFAKRKSRGSRFPVHLCSPSGR
jgi:hypothetical protein